MKIMRFIVITLAFVLLMGSTPADAAGPSADECAQMLHELALFHGSDKGFELERVPTRGETLAMLLRLIGAEKEALNGTWSHPFADAGWANAYIGYAYEAGLTKGMTATQFGTQQSATAQQYATFLLRALGYTSEDFAYENAVEFLRSHAPILDLDADTFTRGNMVQMSVAALAAPLKDGSDTLAGYLASRGLFSEDVYRTAKETIFASSQAETTVLIYMVGSDLESNGGNATADLKEMLNAQIGGRVNVVLQTGGTTEWKNDWMTDGATERFELSGNTLIHLGILESSLMSHTNTLANFLRWGADAYPAERYILVLWNHGGGTAYGFGKDDMNLGEALMLDDLDRALELADVDFELIGFDACLMSTAANAYMLSDYANYLLASEEETSSAGWYYAGWLSLLMEQPDIPVVELAKKIASGYVFDASLEGLSFATISLIDLSHMDGIVDSWQQLTSKLYDQLSAGKYSAFKEVWVNAKSLSQFGLYDQLDFEDWLACIQDAGLADTVALRQKINDAVLFVNGAAERYSGLGIYMPYVTVWNYQDEGIRDALVGCGFSETVLAYYDLLIQESMKNAF